MTHEERQEAGKRAVSISQEKLSFLDISGVATSMTRQWGRAREGRRVIEATLQGHWKMLTTLGTTSLHGIDAAMTVESATGGDVFRA